MTNKTAHTRWPVAVAIGLVGSLIVAIVVLAFLWPAKTSSVHALPVSVSGPEATVAAFTSAIDANAPGTFEFVRAADRDAAINQIERRETYGGVVLSDSPLTPPEVLTAPAAGPAPTQILTGVATQLQVQLAQQAAAAGADPTKVSVTTTVVVPLSESDPSGTGLVAASFPLTLGGMIGGILISLLVVGAVRRLLALAGFAVGVGLVLTLILQSWFEYLQGDFWINATAMGLSILATSAFIVGCTSLLGRAGIAIGAILTMFVGNPLAAAAAPWQFLPEPWGAIGQFMVPGAANTLIRSLSYFPEADNTAQWLILCAWTLLGVALTVAGHFRSQAAMNVPSGTLEEDLAISSSDRTLAPQG